MKGNLFCMETSSEIVSVKYKPEIYLIISDLFCLSWYIYPECPRGIWNWHCCGVGGNIHPWCSTWEEESDSQWAEHEFPVEDTVMHLTPCHLPFLIVQTSAAWRMAVLSWPSLGSTFTLSCFTHCFFTPSSSFLPAVAYTLQGFTSLACFSIPGSSTARQLSYRIYRFKPWKYAHLNWYVSPPASYM